MKEFIGKVNGKHGIFHFCHYDQYIGLAIREYGEFSEIELSIMQKFIENGDVIFDIGANVGAFTMPFAKKVGEKGEVYCFEPQDFIYDLLCKSIEENNLKNVRTFHNGLGENRQKIEIDRIDYSSLGNFGGVGLKDDYDNAATARILKGEKKQMVEIIRLDDFLNIKKCNFIKMDVEMMEIDVLKGGKKFIEKYRPIMWLENHIKYPNQINDYLSQLNYNVFWAMTQLFNPENYFLNDKNYFDDTCTINSLAVPKEKASSHDTKWLENSNYSPKILHTRTL